MIFLELFIIIRSANEKFRTIHLRPDIKQQKQTMRVMTDG